MVFQGLALVCDDILLEAYHLLANLRIQLLNHGARFLLECGNQGLLDLVPHILLNEWGDRGGECSRHMARNIRPQEKFLNFCRERLVDRFADALGDLRPERGPDLVPSQGLEGGQERSLHLVLNGHFQDTGSSHCQLGRESLGQVILEVGIVLAIGVQGLFKPVLCNERFFLVVSC